MAEQIWVPLVALVVVLGVVFALWRHWCALRDRRYQFHRLAEECGLSLSEPDSPFAAERSMHGSWRGQEVTVYTAKMGGGGGGAPGGSGRGSRTLYTFIAVRCENPADLKADIAPLGWSEEDQGVGEMTGDAQLDALNIGTNDTQKLRELFEPALRSQLCLLMAEAERAPRLYIEADAVRYQLRGAPVDSSARAYLARALAFSAELAQALASRP